METLAAQYPADALAETLQLSHSGFAAHRRKEQRPRRRQDAHLRPLIAQSFEQSRQTYGCLRVQLDLRDLGHRCGKNRIARLMREQQLRPKQKRRFRPRTTDSRHHHKLAQNWLSKVPAPERPAQLWQSDITYLETREGWLYLAFTLDSFSRRCLAHHCRQDMAAELTITAFRAAIARKGLIEPGLIHHSDRGCQYAADSFQQLLRAYRVTPSMSRKANPFDNALAESFVATLKTECFGDTIPETRAAAKLMVFDYIETFYNPRRRHSALGYRSPIEFENASATAQREGCSGGGSKGGETCPIKQVGSSRLCCEQLRGQLGGSCSSRRKQPGPTTTTLPTKNLNH
jgi:transposase InsO family protein